MSGDKLTGEKRPNLPIGYWLKKADELLTVRVNAAQQANGLTRTEWQILNVLHETAPASKLDILEALSPFGDEHTLGSTLDGLVARGLVAAAGSEPGQVQLTGISGIWERVRSLGTRASTANRPRPGATRCRLGSATTNSAASRSGDFRGGLRCYRAGAAANRAQSELRE